MIEAASTPIGVPDIRRARFHAYYIYDVADTIDLGKLQQKGGEFQKAQLELKTLSAPNYVQFAVPPLMVSLPPMEIDDTRAEVRLKIYDYGTIAIRLSFDFSGSWDAFIAFTRRLRNSEKLAKGADSAREDVVKKVAPALNKAHAPLLEDYFIFEVESFTNDVNGEQLLSQHGSALASLMLSETRHLSRLEQEECLRTHFSYFETDLVVIQWDTAFIFDTKESADAAENILEFANTQLVELRTYDARLDSELDEIYKWNLGRSRPHWFWDRRAAGMRADSLRGLLIDIQELNDRSDNALKIMGDAFYARLYRGAATKLGLSDWQNQLSSKLTSVGDIYRYATDDTQHTRSEFMEVVVIFLIALEIVIHFIPSHL